MSSIRTLSLGIVAALALSIAACTPQEPDVTPDEQVGAEQRPEPAEDGEGGEGGGSEEPAGEIYTFVAVDIAFDEAPSEVAAGPVTFELVNEGGATHNVVVDDLGQTVVEANGGETVTGNVTLEPGEYRYHCSIPGHENLMNGTFTVS